MFRCIIHISDNPDILQRSKYQQQDAIGMFLAAQSKLQERQKDKIVTLMLFGRVFP